MQELCPGAQALAAVQQKQQAVTQAWEALQLRMEQRKAHLERGYLLVRFHTAVRAFFPWEGVHVCTDVHMHRGPPILEGKCIGRGKSKGPWPWEGWDGWWQRNQVTGTCSLATSPESDSLMSLYTHGFRLAAVVCHQPPLRGSSCLLGSGEGLYLLGGQHASGAADGGGLLGTPQPFAQAQSPSMAVGRTKSQGGAAATGH